MTFCNMTPNGSPCGIQLDKKAILNVGVKVELLIAITSAAKDKVPNERASHVHVPFCIHGHTMHVECA